MTVEFFNLPYFIFMFATIAIILGLYFLFRNKSLKTRKILIAVLLFSNLALHFLKLTFPPYSTNPAQGMRDVWFINICAVSVLAFPFIFLSKNKSAKDFMFYLGVISGTLAVLIPTEALGEYIWQLDLFRFYYAHIVILVAPLLMVLLKVHTLNYKRIWKMPFYMGAYLLFIITQQVLQAELGIVALRNSDFLNPNYKNPSLIWGPGSEVLAKLFTVFTPDFLTVVPYGAYAGQTKYWPFFYLLPGMFVYFWVLPLLICLPWQAGAIKRDIKTIWGKVKPRKKLTTSAQTTNAHDTPPNETN